MHQAKPNFMAEEVVEKKKRERIKRSAPQKVELPKSVTKDIPTEQTLTVAEAEETISGFIAELKNNEIIEE